MKRNHDEKPESLTRFAKGPPLPVRVEQFIEKLGDAIRQNEAMPVVGFSHNVLTHGLRKYAVCDLPKPVSETIRFAYGDGSLGKKFQIFQVPKLKPAPRFDHESALILGTLSSRHLDYDAEVDIYLLRHSQTVNLTNASVEDEAYKEMKAILDGLAADPSLVNLLILQTGLEPLVVGMYRAVIEELARRHRDGLPLLKIKTRVFLDERGRSQNIFWM